MNLAILHHHLNSGGVTRVVENHVRALATVANDQRPRRVLLLHGGRCQNWPIEALQSAAQFDLQQQTIEGLDYDLTGRPAGRDLGNRIQNALIAVGLDADDTLLHWHNHSLGKNASTPLAVTQLAQQGFRTLLQIHDFAEDFRPSNYRYLASKLAAASDQCVADLLYPQGSGIYYAVLNGRDRTVLQQAGVDAERLHLLPNPISPSPVAPDRSQARAAANSALQLSGEKRLVVYPVRGIRRKNIGEMLLWSAAIDNAFFMVTLAPQNPQERASFDRWAALAAELNLPCRFGAPRQLGFEQSLAASDALLTTSVAEGFGMAFLESWPAGRPLAGRNLTEITGDFTELGLNLGGLYDQAPVPTEWIDQRQFMAEMESLVTATYSAFDLPIPEEPSLQQQLDEILSAPAIDFARLPQSQQAAVIGRVVDQPLARQKLVDLNPRLQLPSGEQSEFIASNAEAVARHFSFEQLGQRLCRVYDALSRSTVPDKIHALPRGEAIIAAFLSIQRLHAIRVEA